MRTVTIDRFAPLAPTTFRRQQGIALVSVLMIMAVIIMLGVGSLVLTESNLMTSENLVANSIARANAEAGVDATVAWLRSQFVESGSVPAYLTVAPTASTNSGSVLFGLAGVGGYVVNGDGTVTLRIAGRGPRSAEHVSEALVVFEDGGSSGGGSPFQGAVVGCEAVAVLGGASIDSFDSRVGAYGSRPANNAGHVKTVVPGALVEITGNSPIHGDVNSTGAVLATGSARVVGNINANGAVDLTANAVYEGDVRTTGDVTVSNSATIYGSVSSNGNVRFTNNSMVGGNVYAGENITFTNGGQVSGNAMAGGSVTGVTWATNVLGATNQNAGPVSNVPVATEDCDPIGIEAVIAQYDHIPPSSAINLGGAAKKVELSPTGVRQRSGPGGIIEYPEYATHAVQLFGSNTTLIRTSGVSVGGSAQLSVAGGHVVLLVDGDFTYGGGGLGLEVASGSTLTILIKGKVHFGSGNSTITSGGLPPINIFSSYRNTGFSKWDSNNVGVKVSGDANVNASFYAPFSSVAMAGSGELFGAVRGRTISVTGSGDIHFDEALAEANMGGGSNTVAGERSVAILSRR